MEAEAAAEGDLEEEVISILHCYYLSILAVLYIYNTNSVYAYMCIGSGRGGSFRGRGGRGSFRGRGRGAYYNSYY